MKKQEVVEQSGSTKVSACTCSHPWQDSRYGHGKRLFNAKGDKSKKEYRCTICKSIKVIN